MGWVTPEQIARAREVDILDYLLANERDNVRRVGGSYRLKDHPSLSIGSGEWFWHSHGFGGRTALDYLTDVRGYGLIDAVCALINESPVEHPKSASRQTSSAATRNPTTRKITPKALSPPAAPERKPFALPPRNANNDRVIAYLQSRGIDKPLILACIQNGSLYENVRYHNCVFVGRDDSGKARFAALRGTMGGFKCDVEGSDKSYGFALPPSNPKSDTVAIFESPVDCLSHQTMCERCLTEPFDGWRLSLGGTALVALTNFLDRHSEIKNCIVCTDNDEAGRRVAADIENNFPQLSISRSPPTHGKDWNETLLSIGNEVNILEDKRKDIRFITSDYKTLFTVKDGDSIKFTSGYDGEVKTLKCRHIDEAHIRLVGKYSDDYHICELAEKMERNGSKCEPIPGQKPMLNILAAKYSEPLKDTEIPMTNAAIRKVVGGKYDIEKVYYGAPEWKNKAYAAILRGKDGVAVLGISDSDNNSLTSLHPYNAQSLKRELVVIEPPQTRDAPAKKPSLLGKLDGAKEKVAERKAVNAIGDNPRKNNAVELG